ncbi:hypothetical protein NQZ79_g8373 [Umbelopsis isabellina]|nr:hypothetical protein NQZ79_g8373 [Umbelopsis isabellina]
MDSRDNHARSASISIMLKNLFAYTAGPSVTKEAEHRPCGQFEENYISFPPLDDTEDAEKPATSTAAIRSANNTIRC